MEEWKDISEYGKTMTIQQRGEKFRIKGLSGNISFSFANLYSLISNLSAWENCEVKDEEFWEQNNLKNYNQIRHLYRATAGRSYKEIDRNTTRRFPLLEKFCDNCFFPKGTIVKFWFPTREKFRIVY